MRRIPPARRKQRGAALIVAVAILIVGVAWFTVGALGKAASSAAEREIRTGLALRAAKEALLAHVAQYAARSDTADPGQLPCPESVNLSNVGSASGSCSASSVAIGRLPWKTLGIDQIRDGEGEPLWYVLSPGFRNPPINFDSAGQLTYNGTPNAAVALIIAPGHPLPVGGCNTVNQQVATRNTAPLVPGNFLECGNVTGNYANPGTSPWTNDRVLAITAAEWADAIAGPVSDRLQRQVAPALHEWHKTQSLANWGVPFLPYASSFSDPSTNDYCGDNGVWEGLPPIAGASSAGCSTSWSCASPPCVSTLMSPLLGLLIAPSCTQTGPNMQCSFLGLMLGAGLFSARVTVTAPGVAGSFRAPITAADITVSPAGGAISNFSSTLSPATGTATLTFDISQPLGLFLLTNFSITIPNLQDAPILADARMSWFLNNKWYRHTYYAAAPGATANPTAPCDSTGITGCLVVSGLAASTGNGNDKRLMLALMGRRLATQPSPCAAVGDCLEADNSSTGDRLFANAAASSTFNDRIAACPYKNVNHASADVVICD